jgi:hypothetical protein
MRIERGYYREDDIAQKLYEQVNYESDIRATGLVYTNNPVTYANYIKLGPMCFIRIRVDNTHVTGFGSGDYIITLPFPAVEHMGVFGGMYHDISTGKRHMLMGQVEQGSNELSIYTLNNQVEMAAMNYTTPVTQNAADYWHIEGWYEVEDIGEIKNGA